MGTANEKEELNKTLCTQAVKTALLLLLVLIGRDFLDTQSFPPQAALLPRKLSRLVFPGTWPHFNSISLPRSPEIPPYAIRRGSSTLSSVR